MELNSLQNWIETSTTKIFPVIFHWSLINNDWWKISFKSFQWFTIEFPLITNGSTYLLNIPTALPLAPYCLPLVPIHYHSTFNGKISQGFLVYIITSQILTAFFQSSRISRKIRKKIIWENLWGILKNIFTRETYLNTRVNFFLKIQSSVES